MNVISVDPRNDPLWCRLVNKVSSSVFHSPSWIQVLSATYGWEPQAYVVLDERGEPKAGLPFCRISDMLGERIVAIPFSDYCDPLAEDLDSWHLLIDRLLPEQRPSLDLRPELDALWNAMHDSTHRAIRKSERAGLTVRVSRSEQDLRTFFEMHLKVRKYKYGLLAQPYSFFQNIWRHFVEVQHGFLLLAIHEDKIVAGDFFLDWKDTLYYKFNASLPGDLPYRPNDLLIWEGVRHAKERGFTSLDFGLSDIDQEGLIRYKRKFGTEEKTISFLRHTPNGPPSPAEKDLRELLGKLTNRFTNHLVPDTITERAGEDLYRLFS